MVKPKNKKNGVKWRKNLPRKQILKNYLKRKKKLRRVIRIWLVKDGIKKWNLKYPRLDQVLVWVKVNLKKKS